MITRYKHLGIHKVTFEYQGGGVYITLNVTKMSHPTAEFRNVVGLFFLPGTQFFIYLLIPACPSFTVIIWTTMVLCFLKFSLFINFL